MRVDDSIQWSQRDCVLSSFYSTIFLTSGWSRISLIVIGVYLRARIDDYEVRILPNTFAFMMIW